MDDAEQRWRDCLARYGHSRIERDAWIIGAHKRGEAYVVIAQEAGLSRARIGQIVARGPRVQLGAGQSAHAPRNRAFIIDFQRRTEKWLSGEGMADEFTAHATLLWATLGWLIDALERRSGSLGAAELAGPPTNSLQPALSFAPSSRRQGPYGGPLLPLE